MATVTGLTAARMLAIEAASVVDGDVIGGNLILTKHDASTINAGSVIGPTGPTGPVATITGLFSARPAASAGLNGQIFFATDKMMAWMCISAAWVLVWVYAPEVAVLPTSPIDQQECIFVADATNGVKWHLRYRAASANTQKWEFIGGQPLMSEVGTTDTISSTTYILPASPVSIVVPFTGVYVAEQQASLYHASANAYIIADITIAGTAQGMPVLRVTPSTVWFTSAGESRISRYRLTLTAGQTVDQRALVTSGSGSIGVKRLQLLPIRVG